MSGNETTNSPISVWRRLAGVTLRCAAAVAYTATASGIIYYAGHALAVDAVATKELSTSTKDALHETYMNNMIALLGVGLGGGLTGALCTFGAGVAAQRRRNELSPQ